MGKLRVAASRTTKEGGPDRVRPRPSAAARPGEVARRVLATLDRCGPLTPGALAQHEQVRPPSMTKVLANLSDGGWIDRVPDPSDGRQQLVSLTDAARTLLYEDRRRRDEWLAEHLLGLDREQRAALRAALPVLEVLADS